MTVFSCDSRQLAIETLGNIESNQLADHSDDMRRYLCLRVRRPRPRF
jgi:hypothetical protein